MATTDKKAAKAITRFFDDYMVPTATKLANSGKECLAASQDTEAESYFVTRERRTMRPADFEVINGLRPETMAGRLVEIWEREGFGELKVLAAPTQELAVTLRSASRKERHHEDVSEFVYVMY